jgi:hypothetical protein
VGTDIVLDSSGGEVSTDGLFNPGTDNGVGTLDVVVVADSGGHGADSGGHGEDSGGGGGVDVPEGFLGRYDECGFGTDPCANPLVCVGRCHLPCNAGCADDEECITFGFSDFGVCGLVVGPGEDCDFELARVCHDGLFCNEVGVCEAPEIGGEGAECDGGTACGEGLLCLGDGRGGGRCHVDCTGNPDHCDEDERCLTARDGSGICARECDPEEDVCDTDNYVCREPLTGGDEACLPNLGDSSGEGGFGDSCGGPEDCADGYECPRRVPGSYCSIDCDEGTECPDDTVCQDFWTFTACAYLCPGGVGECPEGMDCDELFGTWLCHW